MDADSLIRLLPKLLNKGAGESGPASSRTQSSGWSEEQACSDQVSEQTQSDSEQSSQSGSEQSDYIGDGADDRGAASPKPVDLDEIEKFLDGITKSHHASKRTDRPAGRDMAAILREVDELGRRTLSSGTLPGGGGGGRPPPSPRDRRVPPAASESALLKAADTGRRVRVQRQQLPDTDGNDTATLAPLCGGDGKLSMSEPAIGHELVSEEKRKYLNLTADMILLKQRSLEHEIQMKTRWEEHLKDLTSENSALKLELERLQSRPLKSPAAEEQRGDRSRLRALEHRLEEQNRLLDGFNTENARLYRELKQLKVAGRQMRQWGAG